MSPKTPIQSASGILRVRTAFLPRPSPDGARRKLARPAVRSSVAILLAGIVLAGMAVAHRNVIDRKMRRMLASGQSAPFEIQRIRRDLADLEGDENELTRALEARMRYAESQRARDFYIVIDTKAKRFAFKFADRVVRSAPVEIGAARTVTTLDGKRWTFAATTGAFSVTRKLQDSDWKAPEWAYALSGRTPPKVLPEIPSGMGRYVLVFSDGYVIHSPPSAQSPLRGAKPGSFLVPEADLAAIWKRIGPDTRVYIF